MTLQEALVEARRTGRFVLAVDRMPGLLERAPELFTPFVLILAKEAGPRKPDGFALFDAAGGRLREGTFPEYDDGARGLLCELTELLSLRGLRPLPPAAPIRVAGAPVAPPKAVKLEVPGDARWHFLPDGARAVVVGTNAALWELGEGGLVASLAGGFMPAGLPRALGAHHAVAGDPGHAVAWDLRTGRVVFDEDGCLMGTDGASRLFLQRDRTGIEVWELERGRVGRLELAGKGNIWGVRMALGGRALLVDANDPSVQLFDPESYRRLHVLPCRLDQLLADDCRIIGRTDSSTNVWNLATGQPEAPLEEADDFDVLPDLKRCLLVGGRRPELRIVELATGNVLARTEVSDVHWREDANGENQWRGPKVAVSPTAEAAALHGTGLSLVDLATGQIRGVREAGEADVNSLLFHRDGTLLLQEPKRVRAWDVAADRELQAWTSGTGEFDGLLTPSNGRVIATVRYGGAWVLDRF